MFNKLDAPCTNWIKKYKRDGERTYSGEWDENMHMKHNWCSKYSYYAYLSIFKKFKYIFTRCTLFGDGWSQTCTTEIGFTWNGTLSVWQMWGNSIIEGTEACDDGNIANNGGWSVSWAVESGWTWSGINLSVWKKCGNGIKEDTETWDDGNTTDNDGWSSSWTIEAGWTWSIANPSIWQKCGNGIKEGTETCDDGSMSSGDGWSFAWQIETNWNCSGAPSAWYKWGDGVIDPGETCEDSNNINGDGWSSLWAIETGWICSDTPSIWSYCSDGTISGFETWDDSNLINGDGWSSTWTVESGWTWHGTTSVWQKWGNGIKEGTEVCDDGNLVDNDGWSQLWIIENNWTCNGQASSVCQKWGNGKIEGTEKWDDYNKIDNDGWSSNCFIENGWTCQNNIFSACNKSSDLNSDFDTIASTSLYSSTAIILSMLFISNIISFSSFTSFWSFANQLQMILLLILMHVYLPSNVESTIIQNKVMIDPFQYIPINRISLFDFIISWFDSEQRNSKLSEIGLESGSLVANNFSTIALILLAIFIHLFDYTLMLIFKRWNAEESDSKTLKIVWYAIKKTFEFLTFSYYIRTIVESLLIFLLSAFSEVYSFNRNDTSNVISLVTSISILAALIFLFGLSTWLVFKKNKEANKDNKYEEFYSGLKENKVYRIYTPLWMLRRILFVWLLIVMCPYHPITVLSIWKNLM